MGCGVMILVGVRPIFVLPVKIVSAVTNALLTLTVAVDYVVPMVNASIRIDSESNSKTIPTSF